MPSSSWIFSTYRGSYSYHVHSGRHFSSAIFFVRGEFSSQQAIHDFCDSQDSDCFFGGPVVCSSSQRGSNPYSVYVDATIRGRSSTGVYGRFERHSSGSCRNYERPFYGSASASFPVYGAAFCLSSSSCSSKEEMSLSSAFDFSVSVETRPSGCPSRGPSSPFVLETLSFACSVFAICSSSPGSVYL